MTGQTAGTGSGGMIGSGWIGVGRETTESGGRRRENTGIGIGLLRVQTTGGHGTHSHGAHTDIRDVTTRKIANAAYTTEEIGSVAVPQIRVTTRKSDAVGRDVSAAQTALVIVDTSASHLRVLMAPFPETANLYGTAARGSQTLAHPHIPVQTKIAVLPNPSTPVGRSHFYRTQRPRRSRIPRTRSHAKTSCVRL